MCPVKASRLTVDEFIFLSRNKDDLEFMGIMFIHYLLYAASSGKMTLFKITQMNAKINQIPPSIF